MSTPVSIQLDDRDQRFTIFVKGLEAGYLNYSLVHGVVDLQRLEMEPEFDDHDTKMQAIDAVMEILESEDNLTIRASDPAISRWMLDHPDFFDLTN